jgi:predicted membrane protein
MSGKSSCNGALIVGIVAIVAGTVLMLDRMGLIQGSHFFRLWPLILIAIGANTLIQSRGRGHVVGGGMLMLAGILNLLFVFHYFQWSQLWPVMIIGFGVFLIWESLRPKSYQVSTDIEGSAKSVFASVEKTVVSRDFKEAVIETIFGSAEVDMTHAEMLEDKSFLNVNSVFGSVEIRVPDHWNVIIEANAVFGSCENKTRAPLPSSTPKTLIIRGDAVFGSIEVRN